MSKKIYQNLNSFYSKLLMLSTIYLLSIFYVNAQNNLQPQEYNGIKSNQKTTIFSDNFNSNVNNWKLNSGQTGEIKVKTGFLFLKSDKDALTSLIKLEINENEDFEIETEIQFVSGNKKKAFGLQWGRSANEKRFFSFVINADGKYAISKFSGAYVNYVPPTNIKYINATGHNKMTIRKIDNTVYFFINENLVYHSDFMHFYGKLIGFQTSGKNGIKINYLKINKIGNAIINKPPEIMIIAPDLDNTFASINETTKTLQIKGYVKDETNIKIITINNTEFSVENNGYFKADVSFNDNNKNIKLSVTDNQLLTSEEFINIKRAVTINNTNSTNHSSKNITLEEKYYALIIGVNDYKNPSVPDLDAPITDAKRLKYILTEFYTFNDEDVTFLQNPTRSDLIIAFDNLSDKIGTNDNLLIFYAGHGYWDENKKQGYWLPADAVIDNTANWFRNSTLKSYISSIETRNILLVADACFSGGIFKSRSIFNKASNDIKQLYSLASRKAMTSGNLKEVPDKSIFLKYMTKRLLDNKEKFLSSEELFKRFKDAVINNTENTPQFGTIKNSGDEGGDFIFIRK